jgi:hypothetical protein
MLKTWMQGMGVAALIGSLSTIAQAELIDRGGGLIYDTDLNITWLADANYGAGSVYDNGTTDRPSTTDGRMTWENALAWAENLTYYDTVRGITYSDWRLPKTLQPDPSCSTAPTLLGYNCSGSEMGHLFYIELGGTAKQTILSSTNPNVALFKNIQEADYWSSTRDVAAYQEPPWAFGFFSGVQSTNAPYLVEYAWAVRDGDVGPVSNASPVCTTAQASPRALWTPKGQFVPVTIQGITDPDNDPLIITLIGVKQDEPVQGPGSGDTSPDAIIQGGSVAVRAERDGSGNGRVYHLTFHADDGRGGTCIGDVTVGVPHSMTKGITAIDDGPLYDSSQP